MKNLVMIIVFLIGFMVQNSWAIVTGVFAVPDIEKNYMIETNVWSESCPVSMDRLRLVSFPFYDFDGGTQQGNMIVLDAVANNVLNIMESLYKMKFPMEEITPIGSYMINLKEDVPKEHNNSASFHCRDIKNTDIYSIHSFGLAIDINPKQNPYVIIVDPDSEEVKNRTPQTGQSVAVEPFEGAFYLNRTNKRPGMITYNDEVVKLFYDNGFIIWGGNWNFPLDSQHFQPSREMANLLALMSREDAEYFFKIYIKSKELKSVKEIKETMIKITDSYHENPKKIIDYIKTNESLFILNPKEIINKYS